MKMRFSGLAAIALAIMLPAGAAATEPAIGPIANAEDLAPLPGGKVVLASSMAGGPHASGLLAAIDVQTGAIRTLYPRDGAVGAAVTPACPQPVAPGAFKPHGIAVQTKPDGQRILLVVNHGGRESIEMFALSGGDKPDLQWIGCAILPPGLFGNAVTATPDGTIYMSNMGTPLAGGSAISRMGGDVVSWRPETGWRTVPGSEIEAPNGLIASPDGKTLYVGSWTGSTVVELGIGGATTTRRSLKTPFLVDNLRWSSAGTIFATGHTATAKEVETCYVSTNATCSIASAMAEIDPAKLTIRCEQAVPFDIATTAVNVGDAIWLGTARGNGIARLTAGCGIGRH